eukprot:400518_1
MISHEKNEKNKDKNGEEHNITIDDDIDCGDAYNDTFIINYTLVYILRQYHQICHPLFSQAIVCTMPIYTRIIPRNYIHHNQWKFLRKQHHASPTIQSFIPSCIINADDAQSTE